MAARSDVTAGAERAAQASWLPMLIIALAQIQMAFNVGGLPVAIGGIVEDLDASPAAVSTALVVYSLAVAGFVMLGAKLGQLCGPRLVFQAGVIVHGLAMGALALSASTDMMIVVQGVAGLAAAALVPTLVVLIATHYRGPQQAQALGFLGAAQASAFVLAFLLVGVLSTYASWRIAFALIVPLAVVVVALSFRLKPVNRHPGLEIDWVGAALAALAMTLISLGFNFLNAWGLLLANPGAPFSILGLSPAPIMIVAGIVLGQGFFAWAHYRTKEGRTPLLAVEVLDSRSELAATFCMFIIGALGPANNFLIPLYIQIVQGRTGLETAVAVVPYSLAIFAGTALIVGLFDRLTPRQIGRIGFVLVAVGLAMLAYTVQNDWGTPLVILSLIVVGFAEGALLTLVFNVLVSASPKELAGDVGALRGTTNNLSTALGTAFASVFAVGVLSALILSSLVGNPTIPPELKAQVALDNIDFVSNDQLLATLQGTTATPAQVGEAVRINTESRLLALKISFLVLALISLLAIFPAGGLPHYDPHEIPIDQPEAVAGRTEEAAAPAVEGSA
jgi:MFS family permease